MSSQALLRYGAAISVGAFLGGGIGHQMGARNQISEKDEGERKKKGSSRLLNEHILKHGSPKTFSPGVQCYSNHCLEYDPQRRTPLWVAEHINRDKLKKNTDNNNNNNNNNSAANRKNSKFKQDENLPKEIRVY